MTQETSEETFVQVTFEWSEHVEYRSTILVSMNELGSGEYLEEWLEDDDNWIELVHINADCQGVTERDVHQFESEPAPPEVTR